MSADEATLAFYRREAPTYTATGTQGPSRHLDAFLESLAPGSRILELGCGGGRDAAHMVERGFRVDPTDGVPAMVRKAQQRYGLPARVMRFDELVDESEFDAVWAHAALLHVPRDAVSDIVRKVYHALKPEGLFFANFKAGEQEGRDRFDRYYNFPGTQWLSAQFVLAGKWSTIEYTTEEGDGFDGMTRTWINVTARKGSSE